MSNAIEIFRNAEFGELRTIEENGKVMFVASDVAKMLGYANTSKAIGDHCKGVTKRYIPTNGGKQEVNIISEGDVYRLITHSKLPAAERFESWVFDEVLPSIRKHGVYAVDEVLKNPDILINALIELKKERAKSNALAETNKQQEQVIRELKPMADYMDNILKSKSLMAITQIAKDYGMSGRAMNKQLHKLGIIYKLGKQWPLYSKYQSCGYTHSETVVITHNDSSTETVLNTKWTQKGRLFLYNMLKSVDVLPVIEQ